MSTPDSTHEVAKATVASDERSSPSAAVDEPADTGSDATTPAAEQQPKQLQPDGR